MSQQLLFFLQDGGERPALAVKRDGAVVKWNYNEYLSDISNVAKAFIRIGVRPYHGVAIWGFNSPEWFIADIAAIFAGAVVSSRKLLNDLSD